MVSLTRHSLQYTGQSVESVNTRCIQHRSGLRSGNEPKICSEKFHQRIAPSKEVHVEDTDSKARRKSLVDKLKAEENDVILLFNCLFTAFK